jgi:predicted Na+-dependent transporter
VLILACVGGLTIPGMPAIPNESSMITLAALMFVSCYKLQEGGFTSIRWRDIGLFYSVRYIVVPPLLWALASATVPDYATAVFLLSVLPAAVSSPAFSAIYGGAVPPAFAIVLLSQLLTPLLIPLQFMLIGSEHVTPSPAHLFGTLVWCILVPMALYALVRKHRSSAAYFYREGKLLSILLIAFIIALAVAKQREVILANPAGVIAPLLISLTCYALYLVIGWWLAARRPRPERITFAACSSFNNAALGVSLALMHFPPAVILFVAASEIGWALLPMLFKNALRFLR